jgi:hypothetical protein
VIFCLDNNFVSCCDWQERYESSYILVAGDLKRPVPQSKIKEFLEALFPSFSYPISSYNVEEALELFGRYGSRSHEIFWSDVRKTIRERQGQSVMGEAFLIKSVLNPNASPVKRWAKLMEAVAVYHFVVVPIRIAFLPWDSMIETRALATDLAADMLTILNLVVAVNTAVLSSSSTWTTKRREILRTVDLGFITAAIPGDWYFVLFLQLTLCVTCWFHSTLTCRCSQVRLLVRRSQQHVLLAPAHQAGPAPVDHAAEAAAPGQVRQ